MLFCENYPLDTKGSFFMSKFKKHLIGDVHLTKDLTLLLLIGGLYSLSIALSNTFVNIYLWKQTGELKDIGLYNLAVAVAQPFTFILAGRWAKKIDRVIVFRIGIISSCPFLFKCFRLWYICIKIFTSFGCSFGNGLWFLLARF